MKTLIIPNLFQAKQKITSFHSMKLLDGDHKFGYLLKKKVHNEVTFELCDTNKGAIAIGRKKHFDFGTSLQIYDMFGGLMGIIQHKTEDPLQDPKQKYCIYDAFGHLMAQTKQQDDLDKTISLYSKNNEKVFSMRRSSNKIKDHWTIQMGTNVDKRLAIFMPIFVSSNLYERHRL